jgi:beta-N-acetylhexosaminidase
MTNRELHRAVGQLITGKVFGTELPDDTAGLIKDGTISGITLFKDNGRDLRQLAELVDSLHRQAASGTFLVSIDQEGGPVQRFEHIIAPMPSPMALAALNDMKVIENIASLQAQHLLALGINCNLIPTLDVNSNRLNPIIATRSYGDDPARIAKIGSLIARTYLRHGVLPVGKHFPGHGDTSEDSHLQLATVVADEETLFSRELAPFAACAADLPSMLVAHVWVKALDGEALPSSLSSNVVTGLLRGKLGYDGFLMTDDIPAMKAITSHWGLEEAAILSINAGIDHLLMCGTTEQLLSVHGALMAAVESGTITEETIAMAIKRREVAAARCGQTFFNETAGGWPAGKDINQRIELIEQSLNEARELCVNTSAAAIFQARGSAPTLLDPHAQELVLVVPDHWRYRMNLLNALSEHIHSSDVSIHERRYNLNPTDEEIAEVVTFAAGKKCLFFTYRALLNPGQMTLSKQLAVKVAPGSALVVTDVPYEITDLPEWTTALALFDASDQGINGLARLLYAGTTTKGQSPVRLR